MDTSDGGRELDVAPTEQVVVFQKLAAAGLDVGEAREQAPVQLIPVRRVEECLGIVFGRAIRLGKERLKLRASGVFFVFCQGFVRQGSYCYWNSYHSRKNNAGQQSSHPGKLLNLK